MDHVLSALINSFLFFKWRFTFKSIEGKVESSKKKSWYFLVANIQLLEKLRMNRESYPVFIFSVKYNPNTQIS